MKKPLLFAWLVLLAMFVSAALRAQDTAVAQEPQLSLEASLSGDDANPVLTVRLTNIGEVPVIVDKELEFMLHISPMYVNYEQEGESIETIDSFDCPKVSELKRRLLPLKPSEKVERQVRLREGFKAFYGGTHSLPDGSNQEPKMWYWMSGELHRMPADFQPPAIMVLYQTNSCFVDYVAENVKSVNAAQFYRDHINLCVTVPYEFTGEMYSDPETE